MIYYFLGVFLCAGIMFGSAMSQCDEHYLILFAVSLATALFWPLFILLYLVNRIIKYVK